MSIANILYWMEIGGFSGGIERFAFQSSMALRRAGWQVDCCFAQPGRDADLFISAFDHSFRLAELQENASRYDAVILHKVPELNVLKKIKALFGRRLIFWAHDHDLYCPGHHWYLPLCRINCHRAFQPLCCTCCALPGRLCRGDTLLRGLKILLLETPEKLRLLSEQPAAVLSGFMRDNLVRNGFSAEKVFVIHPFIRVSERRRFFMPENRLRLLFTGQLIRGKGCDYLLRALKRTELPFELKIAGDGNDRRRLEKLSCSLGLADRVFFIGWQQNPEQCLETADLLVLPSCWQEPFGLAGLEAAAHGIPVIAFNTGGIGEWLKDGINGLLIPERNIEALANGIAHAAALRSRLKRMGAAGADLAGKQFTESRFLSAMENLLEETRS